VGTYSYAVYGLTVRVGFPCPGLTEAPASAPPDIVVTEGIVPRRLDSAVAGDDWWDGEPGRFLLRGGPRAGRFLIDGDHVTLQRNPQAEERMLADLFCTEVLAAVLRHRGMLVLHANAAMTPRGVVAIAGESGAGKSTTLAALLSRGCTMLADDLTVVRVTGNGDLEVLPGSAHVPLTEESARNLGLPVPEPGQLWRRAKAPFAAQDSMAAAPGRLTAVRLLTIHEGSTLRVTRLRGAEKFVALQDCFYGPLFEADHPGLFALLAAAVARVEVCRIERPADRWSIDEVIDAVLGQAREAR
jgi:hypothetical protein